MMDSIAILKGRMAETLVEAVFKRAGYTVAWVGRETQMPALVRTGRAEFMPASWSGGPWTTPASVITPTVWSRSR